MTNVLSIHDIRKTLERKKAHLESVFELTEQQDMLIQSLDVVGLMDNLNVRQKHIGALERLDEALPDRRTLLMNHECARLAVEINNVVDRIQKLDSQNQQKARDCLTFLKGQTKKASEDRLVAGYDAQMAEVSTTLFNSLN